MRDHKEDAYGGGEDGERRQPNASALAAGRTSYLAVWSAALPASCGWIACPADGGVIAALVASGESRLEVFAFPFVALTFRLLMLFLFLLLEAFALRAFTPSALLLREALTLCSFAAFLLRLLEIFLLKPLPLRLFPLLLLAAHLLLPLRLLTAFAFRLPARGEERVRRHIARSGAARAARPFAVRVGVPPLAVAERAGSAVHEPDVVAPAAVADDVLGAKGAESAGERLARAVADGALAASGLAAARLRGVVGVHPPQRRRKRPAALPASRQMAAAGRSASIAVVVPILDAHRRGSIRLAGAGWAVMG